MLGAGYFDNDRIYCVFDDRVMLLDHNGKEISTLLFDEKSLSQYDVQGNDLLLVFGDKEHFKTSSLVLLSSSGDTWWNLPLSFTVDDARVWEGQVIVAGEGQLLRIKKDESQTVIREDLGQVSVLSPFSGGCYLLYANRVEKILY